VNDASSCNPEPFISKNSLPSIFGKGVFVGLGLGVLEGVYVCVIVGGVFVGVEVLPFTFVQAAENSNAANVLTLSILYRSFIIPPGGILVSH
jgi:hypothetical protein